ncbi:MAG: 30S ribosomal protein S17 [Candidatus Taylorbacteria bacterium]|jgi:small subunit ribosomal protein S17|nr:30S ribosomal protein S17 [Candidatus Taylorbacteria bacterium]
MENKVEKNNKGKILKGVIVSAKMKDSIVVSIDSFKKHPKYGKFINKQNKIMAHDEGNKHKEGEVVEIIETRPISKNKKFRVLS